MGGAGGGSGFEIEGLETRRVLCKEVILASAVWYSKNACYGKPF